MVITIHQIKKKNSVILIIDTNYSNSTFIYYILIVFI